MLACPECGRCLEPLIFDDGTEYSRHCWHPDTEEVYGKDMTLNEALQLARGYARWMEEVALEAQGNLQELEEMQ